MEEELTAIQKLIDAAIEFCVNYSFQVLGAIIILILGVMASNWKMGSSLPLTLEGKREE